MKIFTKILLVLTISYLLPCHAQQKPFKTGLALCGGGAKGFAHIGLLQLIDSLEIQIDYITGTSMGAVVGGMYAVGYSGNDIQQSLSNIDWKYLLSNDLPIQRFYINEKDNRQNMIVSLPLKKWRPKLPKFAIEGQYLSEMLSQYFFTARNIEDFHKLPIPFQCIASDMEKGETVILRSGSLARAVRASMAIPAIFSPVYIENRRLFDGGLTRNFPVKEVYEMGADVVIGSYTGFRKVPREEINDLTTIISQSFALSPLKDAQSQMELTDILLDLTENLKDAGVQSFSDYEKIIAIGKQEAFKLLPQLLELKRKQKEAGIEYVSKRRVMPTNVPIQNIIVHDIYEKKLPVEKQKSILAVMGNDKNRLDTLCYLQKKMNKLYAHQFYNKVQYSFTSNNDSTKNLNLYVRPADPSLQIAVHYDTHETAGIILRYTRNNVLLNHSRLMGEIKLSPFIKSNLSYLAYLNPSLDTWLKIEYNDLKEKYNDINFRAISELGYLTIPHINNEMQHIKLTTGYSPTLSTSLTASISFSRNQLKKKSGLLPVIFQDEDSISNPFFYKHNYINTSIAFHQNSLDNTIFATSGNQFMGSAELFFNNSLSLFKPNPNDLIGKDYYQLLNPEGFPNKDDYTNPILRISLSEHKAFPLSKKISLHTHLFYGLNFSKKASGFQLVKMSDYTFIANKFNLGGYYNYRYEGMIPFTGFQIKELSAQNLASLSLSFQWNVWKKLYFTPSVNYASVMDNANPFHLDNFNNIWGIGIDFDYITLLGPIKVSTSVNSLGIPHAFFSLGYQF